MHVDLDAFAERLGDYMDEQAVTRILKKVQPILEELATGGDSQKDHDFLAGMIWDQIRNQDVAQAAVECLTPTVDANVEPEPPPTVNQDRLNCLIDEAVTDRGLADDLRAALAGLVERLARGEGPLGPEVPASLTTNSVIKFGHIDLRPISPVSASDCRRRRNWPKNFGRDNEALPPLAGLCVAWIDDLAHLTEESEARVRCQKLFEILGRPLRDALERQVGSVIENDGFWWVAWSALWCPIQSLFVAAVIGHRIVFDQIRPLVGNAISAGCLPLGAEDATGALVVLTA